MNPLDPRKLLFNRLHKERCRLVAKRTKRGLTGSEKTRFRRLTNRIRKMMRKYPLQTVSWIAELLKEIYSSGGSYYPTTGALGPLRPPESGK